jgi:hypothetical protein
VLKLVASAGETVAHWLVAKDATYRFTAKSLWSSPSGPADAVCRRTDGGWQPRRNGVRLSGDQLRLWGQQWVPLQDNGNGCDTSTHAYRLELQTDSLSTVSVVLGGAGKRADTGTLRVRAVRVS